MSSKSKVRYGVGTLVAVIGALALWVGIDGAAESETGHVDPTAADSSQRDGKPERRARRPYFEPPEDFEELEWAPDPVRERRLAEEAELQETGLQNREELIQHQTRRLTRLADQADADGNDERARLMRKRIEFLQRTSEQVGGRVED